METSSSSTGCPRIRGSSLPRPVRVTVPSSRAPAARWWRTWRSTHSARRPMPSGLTGSPGSRRRGPAVLVSGRGWESGIRISSGAPLRIRYRRQTTPLRSVRDVALQVKLHSQSRGPGIDCCKVMLDICKVLIYIICVIRWFTNKVLERFFATGDGRRLSVQNTRRIANILRALDDASRPEDMNLPGFRFHALVGRDRGRYAVNASGNWRITFGWMDGDAIDVDLEDCR